jgi:hypothetical protein
MWRWLDNSSHRTHSMIRPLTRACAAPLVALLALSGAARAEPLTLRVAPHGQPLLLRQAWHQRGNPNVTPSNPMGVVGWDGPPDDVPSVIGDAGPMPPGSIANVPYEGYGYD